METRDTSGTASTWEECKDLRFTADYNRLIPCTRCVCSTTACTSPHTLQSIFSDGEPVHSVPNTEQADQRPCSRVLVNVLNSHVRAEISLFSSGI
jgi:hypothetical protein